VTDSEVLHTILGSGITLVVAILTHIFYYRKRIALSEKQIALSGKQIEFLSQQIKNITLANLASIVQVERSIGNIETHAFRFHGITAHEMKAAGVTKEELAYLVASFTAGRIYDACVFPEASMTEALDIRHYRYKMLAQEDTRKAWPLIARMMTGNEYIEKLELTIGRIENTQTHG
jgi:hypothetical protein